MMNFIRSVLVDYGRSENARSSVPAAATPISVIVLLIATRLRSHVAQHGQGPASAADIVLPNRGEQLFLTKLRLAAGER